MYINILFVLFLWRISTNTDGKGGEIENGIKHQKYVERSTDIENIILLWEYICMGFQIKFYPYLQETKKQTKQNHQNL